MTSQSQNLTKCDKLELNYPKPDQSSDTLMTRSYNEFRGLFLTHDVTKFYYLSLYSHRMSLKGQVYICEVRSRRIIQ